VSVSGAGTKIAPWGARLFAGIRFRFYDGATRYNVIAVREVRCAGEFGSFQINTGITYERSNLTGRFWS
jgi:hypothetical protein